MISVVIPVYNEQDNIKKLCERLYVVLFDMLKEDAEIIFVDDGSTDDTWQRIVELSMQYPIIKGIRFSRNFGQQNALTAGLDFANGDAVITMDGDLQHPPEFISDMIKAWRKGYDIVYAKRKINKDYGWFKRFTSSLFAVVFNKLSSIDVPQGVVDFRLISREVAQSLKTIRERNRFVRGLVSWVGYKSIIIDYIADHRYSGVTKYSFLKSLRLAMASIISFSPIPLYLSGIIGFCVVIVSALYIFYALYIKFFTPHPLSGWASILISVLFLGGVQLLAIGILGNYLAMIYEEVKARPLYVVQSRLGFKD